MVGVSTVGLLFNNNPSGEEASTSSTPPSAPEPTPSTLTPAPEPTLPTPTTPSATIPNQPESQTQQQPPAEPLNANYSELETLLREEKWREADEETYDVMLEVSRRQGLVAEQQGLEWLSSQSINNFSCPDLKKIDQLWRAYSNDRFGFSVQKRIWLEVGGQIDEATADKLYERLGWRKTRSSSGRPLLYHQGITFDRESPEGHLPIPPNLIIILDLSTTRHIPFLVFTLAQRVAVCGI